MRNSIRRINAIVWRHTITWTREIEGLLETLWWPTFDLVVWGLMSLYIRRDAGMGGTVTTMVLSGIILWMIVYRSQQELGFTFLKEIWDRNLVNIMTSPVSIAEFTIASLIIGGIKLAISVIFAMAIAFFFFSLNIFTIGWGIIPFIINLLLVGWWAGFFIQGMILRFGNRVQAFVWSLVVILQPFSAVFYPVSILPGWMQVIARFIPSSYVFEGLRGVLAGGAVNWQGVAEATILNIIYILLSILFFLSSWRSARRTGMIQKFA